MKALFEAFHPTLSGVRENPKFQAQLVRLRPKQDQLVTLRTNHNRSNPYAQN